jgi:TonB family protein
MMTKNHSCCIAQLKLLLVIPAIVFLVFLFSSCAVKKKTAAVVTNEQSPADEEPFVVVEEMPLFPGGDSALLNYIIENTKYPESAKANKITGRVIVRFCVTKTGGVDRISVIKGADPDLDKEALRVVSSLTPFKPGKQGGKAVPVWYMVPIQFGLDDKTPIAPPPPPPPPPLTGKNITNEQVVIEVPQSASKNKEPFVLVEEMPMFPGVVSSLPAFKPGKQRGVPVAVWYMTPVDFILQ